MIFSELIHKLTKSIVKGNGEEAASCFHNDGGYNDIFYGYFPKRKINSLVNDYFHRDAEKFVWNVEQVSSTGKIGFAQYSFSYTSKMAKSKGKRAFFEGVSICELRNGLIYKYSEVAEVYAALAMMNFSPSELQKLAARQAKSYIRLASKEHLLRE